MSPWSPLQHSLIILLLPTFASNLQRFLDIAIFKSLNLQLEEPQSMHAVVGPFETGHGTFSILADSTASVCHLKCLRCELKVLGFLSIPTDHVASASKVLKIQDISFSDVMLMSKCSGFQGLDFQVRGAWHLPCMWSVSPFTHDRSASRLFPVGM